MKLDGMEQILEEIVALHVKKKSQNQQLTIINKSANMHAHSKNTSVTSTTFCLELHQCDQGMLLNRFELLN